MKDSGKKITATLNVYVANEDEESIDWSDLHIVGTSEELEKRYFRLTSVFLHSVLFHGQSSYS